MYRRRTCAALQTWGSALLIKAMTGQMGDSGITLRRDRQRFFLKTTVCNHICYFGSQCRHVLLDSFQSWSIYGIGWTPPLRTGRYHDHPLRSGPHRSRFVLRRKLAHKRSKKENCHDWYCTTVSFKTVNCAGLPGNRKKKIAEKGRERDQP